jgi:hypothetical protein
MAITTIDGALAGALQPTFFSKALGGTMVAGRAHTFWNIAGFPPSAAVHRLPTLPLSQRQRTVLPTEMLFLFQGIQVQTPLWMVNIP